MSEIVGGTGLELQGFHGLSASIRLSLGLTHDVTVVTIVMPEDGFPTLSHPEPGKEYSLVAKGRNVGSNQVNNLGNAPSTRPTTGPATAFKLVPVGELTASQNVLGDSWEILFSNLLVEQVTLSDPGNADPEKMATYDPDEEGAKTLRITLVDQRRLWPSHSRSLPQFEFNVKGSDGRTRENTRLDGKKATVEAMAKFAFKHVTSPTGKGYEVVRVPKRWTTDTPTIQLEPGASGYDLAGELLSEYPARTSLHVDGTLGFWEPGEGKVGYSKKDEKNPPGGNDKDLPEKLLTSHVTERTLGWAPGFLIASGPPTIATVAVDLIPVIFPDRAPTDQQLFPQLGLPAPPVDDDPDANKQPLDAITGIVLLLRRSQIEKTEGTIAALRQLQQGQGQLTPEAAANVTKQLTALQDSLNKITAAKAITLREYRFAMRFMLAPDTLQNSKLLTRESAAILRRDLGKTWMVPPGNEHLLPIENRAETNGEGIRLPPKVQSYRWAVFRSAVSGTAQTLSSLGPLQTIAETNAFRALHNLRLLTRALNWGLRREPVDERVLRRLKFTLKTDGELTGTAILDEIKNAGNETGRIRQRAETALLNKKSRIYGGKEGVLRVIEKDPAFRAQVERSRMPATRLAVDMWRDGLAALDPAFRMEGAGFTGLEKAYRSELAKFHTAQRQTQKSAFYTDLSVQFVDLLFIVGEKVKNKRVSRRQLYAGDEVDELARAAGLVSQAASRIEENNRRKSFGEPLSEDDRGAISDVYATARHVVNLPKADDASFELVDPERGVWRTESPPGHSDRTDVPDISGAALVWRPVTAFFGVTAKPKLKATIAGRTITQPTTLNAGTEAANAAAFDGYAKDLVDLKVLPDASFESGRPLWRLVDNNQSQFPPQLQKIANGEVLGFFQQAYKRPAPPKQEPNKPRELAQAATPVPLATVPADQGSPLFNRDLQELIQLTGTTNRSEVEREAGRLVSAKFAEFEPEVSGRVRVFKRLWRVNPNGRISGVEWRTREGGLGWETEVTEGFPSQPFRDQNSTYVPKRRQKGVRSPSRNARYPSESRR